MAELCNAPHILITMFVRMSSEKERRGTVSVHVGSWDETDCVSLWSSGLVPGGVVDQPNFVAAKLEALCLAKDREKL